MFHLLFKRWWRVLLYNLVFVLRPPEKLRERPGGHGDQAGLSHPPPTEQQLLNLASIFSRVCPRGKTCPRVTQYPPQLSGRALVFISEFTSRTVRPLLYGCVLNERCRAYGSHVIRNDYTISEKSFFQFYAQIDVWGFQHTQHCKYPSVGIIWTSVIHH